MCGRYSQYRKPHRYAEALGLPLDEDRVPAEWSPRYNLPPTARASVLHLDGETLRADPVPWGWSPFWAKGKRPAPINARVETVASGKFFKPIWSSGRCIVGADGWFEWKKDPDKPKVKQPYFIHLKSGEPLLFAAIGHFPRHEREPSEDEGFVIITGGADSGLIDVHDRKPLVLSPETARAWLSPDVTPEQAEQIANVEHLPAEAFDWYPVSRAVGNVRNEGPHLIERIDDPLL